MSNEQTKIKCSWCGSLYASGNTNRTHCRKPDCRKKEIDKSLRYLSSLIGLILRYDIISTIEINLPGNDTIGRQAKISSFSTLKKPIQKKPEINGVIEDQTEKIREYFSSLLWKGIRGNFFIKTEEGGNVNDHISHEMFTFVEKPSVLGNNIAIHLSYNPTHRKGGLI